MRVRLQFTKLGKVRWTSHRDVARMWERALRRAGLAVIYTGGFTPRPKVSFGLALPTGHESVAEYLDVELAAAPLDASTLPARLSPALPVGVDVLAAAVIDEPTASLQEDVSSCAWDVEVLGTTEAELAELVARALAAESLVITRERKGTEVSDDVRPGIRSVALSGPSPCVAEGYEAHAGGVVLSCELATHPRGLRPVEFLRALGPELEAGHVRRLHQWIERDGARWEPLTGLSVGATDAPHAQVRAS
jgi:radical SAM-linked protein